MAGPELNSVSWKKEQPDWWKDVKGCDKFDKALKVYDSAFKDLQRGKTDNDKKLAVDKCLTALVTMDVVWGKMKPAQQKSAAKNGKNEFAKKLAGAEKGLKGMKAKLEGLQ
jgi:hypothetical protein